MKETLGSPSLASPSKRSSSAEALISSRRVTSAAPVDYVSAGPVAETPTKPGRPPTGLGYIGVAADRSPWPVWVTGGVAPSTVPGMVESGARHFVVVLWLTGAADPRGAARQLRDTIEVELDRSDPG